MKMGAIAVLRVVEGDGGGHLAGETVVDDAVEGDAAVADVQDAVDERVLRVGDLRAGGDLGGLLLEPGDGGDAGDFGVIDGDLGGGEAGLDLEFGAGAILVGVGGGGTGGGERGLQTETGALGLGLGERGLGPGGTEHGLGLELAHLERERQAGEHALGGTQFETRADDLGFHLGLDGLGRFADVELLGREGGSQQQERKDQAGHRWGKSFLTHKWFP